MIMFFRFLKNEINTIFHSSSFRAVICLLLALIFVDDLLAYRDYTENLQISLRDCGLRPDGVFSVYPFLQIYTVYNSWIGGRGVSTIPISFFFSLPIFSVIPYSASFLSEEKNGYAHIMVSHMGKLPYFIGKYFSALFSGFFVTVIPLTVSFLLAACLIPAYRPDVNVMLYYQVADVHLLRDLYYWHPLLTTILNMCMIGLFSGIWATVPYTVSFFVKNKFVVLFAPYLVLLFLTATIEHSLAYRSYLETNIMNYIRLTSPTLSQNLWVFVGEILFLFAVPFTITLIRGKYADVY